MVHGPPEGHARRTVPERLSELAPPWETKPLREALSGSPLGTAESPAPGSPSSFSEFSDAGGNRTYIDAWYEPGWALYRWQPPVEHPAPPPRGARIATSARRLMALERRRIRRSTGASSLDRRPRTPPGLF